jgi:tetratricopeptide (TPR) repeat protein
MMSDTLQFDEKIMALVAEIEIGYWQSNIEQHSNCKKLLEACVHHKHPMLNYAYFLFGRTHLIFGKIDEAVRLIKKSISLTKKNPSAYLASMLLWYGVANYKQKAYAKALDSWMEALAYAHEHSQLEVAIEVYLNIGLLYQMTEKVEECSALLKNGLSIAILTNNKKLIAKSCIFLSDSLIKLGDYNGALLTIDRSECDVILYGDLTWVVQLCKNKGICLQKTGQTEDSIVCFEAGLAIARKFNLNWAFVDTALAYAEVLLEQKKGELADEVLHSANSFLAHFPDSDLQERWHKLRYTSKKDIKQYAQALPELKASLQCQLKRLESSFLDASREKIMHRLTHNYPNLRRDFKRFERLADLGSMKLGVNPYIRFRDRCEDQMGQSRVIELIITRSHKTGLDKLIVQIMNDYCSEKDAWIQGESGHYYIFPARQDKSLHDFSLILMNVIKEQAIFRLNLVAIKVRSRLLLTSAPLLEKINELIARGWHES